MTSKKSKGMSDESTYNRCFIFFEYQACFEFKRPKSLLLENRKTHKAKNSLSQKYGQKLVRQEPTVLMPKYA